MFGHSFIATHKLKVIFYCYNHHKLAGLRGYCDRCGAEFDDTLDAMPVVEIIPKRFKNIKYPL